MKNRGYSLIEVVIVVILIAIIVTFIGGYILQGFKAWMSVSDSNTIQAEAKSAMEKVLNAIRVIPSTASINTANGTELEFDDITGNTQNYQLDSTGAVYFLSHNGTSLTDKLTSSGLQFSYFDENGVTAASISDIRVIEVNLNLQDDTAIVNLESAARLRTP